MIINLAVGNSFVAMIAIFSHWVSRGPQRRNNGIVVESLSRNFHVFPPGRQKIIILSPMKHYLAAIGVIIVHRNRLGPEDIPLFEGSWPEIPDIFHRPVSS